MKFKQNKAITLIALIVTIVVLIILAGVAISIALGENGIFTKSKLAADTYINSASNEVKELKKADKIIGELMGEVDYYDGQATAEEVKPQIFMYEIINPATASTEEGVDGVTKLADTSDTLKIAATSTKPTAKIVGINYDYVFGDLPEYSSYTDETGPRYDEFSGTTRAGSGYDNTDTEASHAKFENIVKENYSKLVIPAKVKLNASGEYDVNGTEYTITQVGACGSYNDSGSYVLDKPFINNVTEIILPNTIVSLNDDLRQGENGGSYCAFGGSAIVNLDLPNSLVTIGDAAFKGCSSLTSVTIPSSVTSIGDAAFKGCSSLTSVTIPNSVTSIGDDAFNGCSSLTSVTIPNGVTSIGSYAFEYCNSLTSITIPNSVTSIGESAFSGCSSLTSVTIPNSVTSIEYYAFDYLAENSKIYVQSQAVADLLSGKYNSSKTTVVVDPSKF